MSLPSAVDLLIVGGGINGAGIARDAAGRGLSVLLAEAGDLAGATSSASSKLVHGGLRYLELGEFRLVREALAEREVLLGVAPHLVRPTPFVLPHDRTLRPRWMLRLGLLLYDHLGGRRRLPASERIDPRRHPFGGALRGDIAAAFVYADCRVDDARLVVANARDAARRGARILTRTEFLAAERVGAHWRARLRRGDGTPIAVEARALVNAAGPWAMEIARRCGVALGQAALRLVKGSHIVVPRLYQGSHAYILQNTDRRIVFVLPFEDDFTLIGTTELPFEGDPATVASSPDEEAYLCRAVSRWFAAPVAESAIVWRYAGVRPLYEDHARNASAVTRDYVLSLDHQADAAPVLSVLGGKITTYRRLAEHALERLGAFLPAMRGSWTAGAPLPGGDSPPDVEALRRRHPWLAPAVARRLVRSYGSEAAAVLGGARAAADLGEDFGAGLWAREVAWLCREEWAETADDILWRRSKLGLRLAAPARARLAAALAERGR